MIPRNFFKIVRHSSFSFNSNRQFKIKPNNLFYTKTHETINFEKYDIVKLGISNYTRDILGNITDIKTKYKCINNIKTVKENESIISLENTRTNTTINIKSPYSGKVIELNYNLINSILGNTTSDNINDNNNDNNDNNDICVCKLDEESFWLIKLELGIPSNKKEVMNLEQYLYYISTH